MIHFPAKLTFGTMVVLFCGTAQAATKTETEISALMNEIKSTNCTFYRNDRNYPVSKLVKQIEKKHKRYSKDIKNAEDFISLTASRSKLTKKPYFVVCNGDGQTSEEWLTSRLQVIRGNS